MNIFPLPSDLAVVQNLHLVSNYLSSFSFESPSNYTMTKFLSPYSDMQKGQNFWVLRFEVMRRIQDWKSSFQKCSAKWQMRRLKIGY